MFRPERKAFGAVLLLAFLSFPAISEASIQCKNDANEDVDWYLIYKLPQNPYNGRKRSRTENLSGRNYIYVDANTPESANHWTLSHHYIDNDTNALANTLAPLYGDKPKDYAFAVYNDHPPGLNSSCSYGHTKGFFMFDEATGFWVVHSVPRFPQMSSDRKYELGQNAIRNAQMILCITFPVSELDKIATHVNHQDPRIYYRNATEDMIKKYENLQNLLNKKRPESKGMLNETLESVGKNTFTSFAKHKTFKTDVYSFIASYNQTNLAVSTWLHGNVERMNRSEINVEWLNEKELVGEEVDGEEVDGEESDEEDLDGEEVGGEESDEEDLDGEEVDGVESDRGDVEGPRCGPFVVVNVNRMQPNLGEGHKTVSFRNTKDHSKWAVSFNATEHAGDTVTFEHHVCIGTLNRVVSQTKRGGGTLCFENPTVHRLLYESISHVEDCEQPVFPANNHRSY